MAEQSDTKFMNTAAQYFLSTNIALEVRVTSCELYHFRRFLLLLQNERPLP
jgi:phosphoribosylcarboxyaminoimidazole (NCAIR) mutase